MRKNAVDIFSGAGGLSLGAEMAGIKTELAVEYDKYAAQTFIRNHPDAIVLNQDIKEVQPLQYIKKYPFVLMGGPPCQGFSIANTKTRNLDNPNNVMYKEYLRFVEELKPTWFVFENVVGFKSFNRGELAKEVEKELESLGYTTNSTVLNAADFGVPQSRCRFFIIGNINGIKFDFDALERKHPVTVQEALEGLPSLVNGQKLDEVEYTPNVKSDYAIAIQGNLKKVSQNYVSQNKTHIIERYKVIKQGQNWEAAKQEGLLSSYNSTKHTHSGIYKRLEENKPSVTISNYRKSMLIHPTEDRGLSLREAARLQSFPDNFHFEGLLSFQQQQVGNAVPPLLAKAIFREIIKNQKKE
ncbi:MAG: DNA cytosine methyltransferase [Sulfurospirillaceae bacterium]|nr:DNA cytosine methyltransferase [Sulfurospirillaceae bacterium]